MATRAELAAALKAADAAGDDAGARTLAAALTNYSDDNTIASPAPAPAAPAAAGLGDDVPMWQRIMQYPADSGRLIGNGLTFGGYDKLMGKIAPYIGGSDEAGQRAITKAAQERGGVMGSTLELGSSMVPAALTDGATAAPALGTGLRGLLAKAGVAAGEGAGYGGIQADFTGEDPLLGMKHGAVAGVAGQAAAGLIGKLGSKVEDLFTSKPPRLTVDNLTTAKNQAYDAVNQAGVEYTPGTIRGMLADMDNAVNPYPGRHDQVIAARDHIRDRLGATPRPVSLSEVDLNRQIIGRDLNSLPDKAQQGMGLDMTRAMDDHLNQVTPLGVTARSGDPADGLDTLNQARGLNSRLEKLDEMTRVEDKAELQAAKSKASGFDDTMRNNVSNLLTNEKKMRGYTPDEEAAMREVVTGGSPWSRTNVARMVGRLAPGGGLSLQGGLLAGGLGALAPGGSPLVGAAMAAAPSVVGLLGKAVSKRGTRQASNALLDTVANGAPAPPPKSMSSKDRDQLGRFLMMMQLQGQR